MSARELSYAEAIREALGIALERDERVFLMGEDIGVYGGAFQVTGDLVERFGEERVMDTPISELGGAGVAVGAALTGMRPVYEFQFSDFSMLAMEQIVNQAAKLRYMLGGAVNVPVVFRMPTGSGLGGAAQHSQSIEAWYAHVPGLKVVEPSTPEDVKGMLLAAIKDPDPVIVFEHKLLYKMKGATPEGYYETPLDRAVVRREGRDLTIVATAIMVHRALEAADMLAKDGIKAEVIDLRSLRPIDKDAIVMSVKKTGRLLAVYEGVKTLGIGAEISAIVAESEAFDYLEAPIMRLGGAEAPIPYSPVLEKAAVPQVEDIVTGGASSGAGRGLTHGGRDRHAARRHGHDVRPHGPLARRRRRACREGRDAVRDRDRQGGDGGRRAGFGRAEVCRGVRGRRAAGRRLHRLDRRRKREFCSAAGVGPRADPSRCSLFTSCRGRRGRRRIRPGCGWRAPARDARRPTHGARARIAA